MEGETNRSDWNKKITLFNKIFLKILQLSRRDLINPGLGYSKHPPLIKYFLITELLRNT